MKGRVASTRWLPSLTARTVSRVEVTLSILKMFGVQAQTEESKGDSDRKQSEGRRMKQTTADESLNFHKLLSRLI